MKNKLPEGPGKLLKIGFGGSAGRLGSQTLEMWGSKGLHDRPKWPQSSQNNTQEAPN